MLPEIVGLERLVQINGLNATLGHGARMLGAAFGGALLSRRQLALPFVVTAAFFAASGLLLLGIPGERLGGGPRLMREGYLATLGVGLQHGFRQCTVRLLLCFSGRDLGGRGPEWLQQRRRCAGGLPPAGAPSRQGSGTGSWLRQHRPGTPRVLLLPAAGLVVE